MPRGPASRWKRRYVVRLTVPRPGGWRAWGAVRADFERGLADAADPAIVSAEVASELRRGADYVRVTLALTVVTTDMADALAIAWDAFRSAARDDLASWEMTAAAAQVQPEPSLIRASCHGIAITRPAWKNLVFTGGPGTGKSRAAAAIAGLYRDLGVLRYGNLIEIPAIDLPGPTARDTAAQVTEAVKGHRGPGDDHRRACLARPSRPRPASAPLPVPAPDRSPEVPQRRTRHHPGRPGRAAPRHAARRTRARRPVPAVIDFPGYTPAQLTAVLHALAAEAGLTLTPDATRKAAAVLAAAENGHAAGNARLAVQLLTEATTSQAHRITTSPQPPDPAALAAICAADIPERMPVPAPSPRDQYPGQYL